MLHLSQKAIEWNQGKEKGKERERKETIRIITRIISQAPYLEVRKKEREKNVSERRDLFRNCVSGAPAKCNKLQQQALRESGGILNQHETPRRRFHSHDRSGPAPTLAPLPFNQKQPRAIPSVQARMIVRPIEQPIYFVDLSCHATSVLQWCVRVVFIRISLKRSSTLADMHLEKGTLRYAAPGILQTESQSCYF